MPKNKNETYNLHDCSFDERSKHSHTCQLFWYEFVTQWTRDLDVLDVGAGRGDGVEVVEKTSKCCIGIDPLPMRSGIQKAKIEEYVKWTNYKPDIAIAMDVIEHVENDKRFLTLLCEIAGKYVFFSTPNWNVHKCKNQFHVREYTPTELKQMLIGYNYRSFEADATRNIIEVEEIDDSSLANDFGVLIEL